MSQHHTYSNTRIRWFWIISIVSLIAFVAMSILVISEKVVSFDSFVIKLVRGFEQPSLTWVAKVFTYLGSNIPIVIICLAVVIWMYKVLHLRREVIFFAVVILGSAMLNVILKNMFRRIRPDINRLIDITGYSFPSGHSMAAFTMYGILTYLLWKRFHTTSRRNLVVLLFSVIILCIGLSRIYLGVHYPSDVLGGYLASCAWLMFSIGVYEVRRK